MDQIVEWITRLMSAFGAPGAGAAVAMESVFPPIPSEVILPLAGFTASRGDIDLLAAIGWTTAGSTVGALVLYAAGALLGQRRTRAIAARIPLMRASDVERAEAWFARHGRKAVFVGRMVPLVRSLISVPAGIDRMPLPAFLACTAAGSLIWNAALLIAGYLLGRHWYLVEQYVGGTGIVVLCLFAVALVWAAIPRWVQYRRERADEDNHT